MHTKREVRQHVLQALCTLLTETTSKEDQASYLWLTLTGTLAYDPQTEAELSASHARRRSGRPTHYLVTAPTGKTYIMSTNQRWRRLKQRGKVFRLSAFTETEAITKANALFQRKFASFCATAVCPDTLDEIASQITRFATEQIEKRYDPYHHKQLPAQGLSCELLEPPSPTRTYRGGIWRVRLCYEQTQVSVLVQDTQDLLAVTSWSEEEPDV